MDMSKYASEWLNDEVIGPTTTIEKMIYIIIGSAILIGIIKMYIL